MADKLNEKILEVLRSNPCVVVSTVDGDKPRSRYMVVGAGDDLLLTSATFIDSRKVAQIKANPSVAIVAGYNPSVPNSPYVNIEATATIHTDDETRRNNWNETLLAYFTGPDDDKYAVLQFNPVSIEYWIMGAHQPQILEM